MANRSQGILSQVYRALAGGTFGDALFTGNVTINGNCTILSDMYFGNAIIDTMIVTAHMKLYSGSDIRLYSDAGVTKVGEWDGATGDITLANGMYIKNSVNTAGDIYGGNATADTLNLYANTVDAYPSILMTGAGGTGYYVTNAFDHNFYHGTELGLKVGQTIIEVYNNISVQFEGIASDFNGMTLGCDASGHGTLEVTAGSLYLTSTNAAIILTPGTMITSTLAFTGQTTETRLLNLNFTTDSTYTSGDPTYSGTIGSSQIKLTGTHTNTLGELSNIYSLLTASNNYTVSTGGAINIKAVTLSTDTAITDGNLYGGLFIAKKAGTGVATAQVAVVGVEGWFMETGSGEVRTGIGGNFGWHADSSAASHTGAVWRGVQIFCDSAGTTNANETTALYLWGMTGTTINGLVVGAGTWTNGIRFIAGGTVATGILMEGTMTTAISIGACTTGITVTNATSYGLSVSIAALTTGDGYSGIRSVVACANPNNSLGAAGYFEANTTGTQAGTFVYGTGSWVNVTHSCSAGQFICAQDNGVYYGSGTITGAKVIFGLRMESLMDIPTAVTGTGRVCPFSLNTNNKGITALFDCQTASDLGTITNAGTDVGSLVPLFIDNSGNLRYVRVYTAI